MKKTLLSSVLFIFLIFIFFFSNAYPWVINDYAVKIKVEPNSELKIVEKLVVDFGKETKHGIYRDIPLEFIDPTGKKHKLQIDKIFVKDEDFNSYPIKIYKQGNVLRIRIGDPNKLVSGIQNYIINYRVRYALYNIGDIDELYWNAIGTGWTVNINKGSAKVILPFDDRSIQVFCYTGIFGGRGKDCKIKKEKNEITFFLSRSLSPHEGMTIAVGWKAGLIPIQTGPPWWKNPWIYMVIYLSGLFSFLFWLWWSKGRDVGGKGVIQVQYEPPEGLTPLEAGTLIDEKLNPRDIVAEIIDLARRGYIKIIETEEKRFLLGKKRNYIFEKIKGFDNTLPPHDHKLLDAIFEDKKTRTLSDLKKKFSDSIPEIEKLVFSTLTKKGLFYKNPLSIKNIYVASGVIIFFFTLLLLMGFAIVKNSFPSFPFMISGVVTSFSLSIFGQFMPRKTEKGTLMKEYLQGYEEFISRVEKNIIEKLFPPEKIPEIFEITLPYALAFGEAEKWVSAFEGLFMESPKWYEGRGDFSLPVFTQSINSFTNDATQILSSVTRSSGSGGGGFSGGGGGGGGGGAW